MMENTNPSEEKQSKMEEMDNLEIININNNNNIENSNILNKDNIELSKNNKNGFLKFIGIIIIILIAISNTTSAELSQYIIINDFDSSFMITWFNVSFSVFSILIELILLKIELFKKEKQQQQQSSDNIKISFLNYYKSKFVSNDNSIKLKKLFSISIPMSILFLFMNWIWLYALPLIDVSISTALYQRIRFLKTISVIIFMAGIIGITLGTTLGTSSEIIENQILSNKVKGYLLMILSASLYGLYEVLVSKILGDVNRTIVHTYLAFIGFIGFLIGIPIMVIFNFTNFELFKIPHPKSFGIIFSNTVIIFSINYLINWGLSITSSPLFVRAGELMAIPLTLIFDIIIKHMKLPLVAIPGYILIVIGFILSIYIECNHIKKK
ncbi:hypothetical protein DDB_G0291462 [Dictyostelium discoideum AX4]|uniref:EamA domain-containing protein n=1 Tax=Dictyostelium discoideum TaxID=44689 RepID=Q54EL2_DICDI|nr:hypothetical protein DDB_G0291462 [Dictyostelium discoideum AX4]EAL61715.1 hypothetical protein DDB_G0291462 [Dictyostelium discoideum AX4]|eukprot:XP_635228.1 hypothetical protein DDB_G0291462 [Dictyostelium discoideum AX4]